MEKSKFSLDGCWRWNGIIGFIQMPRANYRVGQHLFTHFIKVKGSFAQL
jgi:hypothetical protein